MLQLYIIQKFLSSGLTFWTAGIRKINNDYYYRVFFVLQRVFFVHNRLFTNTTGWEVVWLPFLLNPFPGNLVAWNWLFHATTWTLLAVTTGFATCRIHFKNSPLIPLEKTNLNIFLVLLSLSLQRYKFWTLPIGSEPSM